MHGTFKEGQLGTETIVDADREEAGVEEGAGLRGTDVFAR